MAEVLVVGAGAREHALGWKLSQSPEVSKVYFAPGNAGTEQIGENLPIGATDILHLRDFAEKFHLDLTVPGPDRTVAFGIADAFAEKKLAVFAPSKAGAKIEASKIHSFKKMVAWGVPQGMARPFRWDQGKETYSYIQDVGPETIVIKADGLADGKGVFLPDNLQEAEEILNKLMFAQRLGPDNANVLIQERLKGREASVHLVTDGKNYKLMPIFRDYKRLLDRDLGPNTGGMGGFGPVMESPEMILEIEESIIKPILRGLRREKISYIGAMYPGVMITEEGPKLLEVNCRFGDPETELLMMLLKSDLYKIMKACVEGKLKEEEIEYFDGSAVCVVLASDGYADPDPDSYMYTGHPIKGLDNIPEGIIVFHGASSIENGVPVTNGGRVLTVTARGELAQARNLIYSSIGEGKINFLDMQYRKDIAQ